MGGFVGRCVDCYNDEDSKYTSVDIDLEQMPDDTMQSLPCTFWMVLLADVGTASLMKT